MIDEHIQETASLYVLGALTPDEARAFEERMRAEPELARLAAQLETAAAAFAVEAPHVAPPAALRAQVLGAIKDQSTNIVPFTRRFAWVAWAAAACFALATGALVYERLKLRNEIETLEGREALSQIRIATLTSQVPTASNSVASVAWDATRQQGVLDVRNLPPLPDDRDYQLWVIDPQYSTPVNAGVFEVTDGAGRTAFRPELRVSSADKFAVSIERKGGSPRHTGPIVLLGP